MKNIYLVRHAQSHANAGGHAIPNADIPITALGQEQANQVADWLIETLGDTIQKIVRFGSLCLLKMLPQLLSKSVQE